MSNNVHRHLQTLVNVGGVYQVSYRIHSNVSRVKKHKTRITAVRIVMYLDGCLVDSDWINAPSIDDALFEPFWLQLWLKHIDGKQPSVKYVRGYGSLVLEYDFRVGELEHGHPL